MTLLIAIIGPLVVSAEYLYFRVVVPVQQTASSVPVSTKIPAPFVNPGIIVVQPPETEPPVTTTPRPTGKHRATDSPPTAPSTTPTGTRRVAPATTTPPATTTTTPPPPTTPPAAPTSSAVTSPTPIYDTLRNETLATNPNLETVIPE